MPSSDPWDFFDFVHKIERVAVTKMTVDQATGAVVAPTTVVTVISGHVSFDPEELNVRERSGIAERGDALLWTETTLAIGDNVNIYLDSTNTVFDAFQVIGVQRHDVLYTHVSTPNRKEYVLRRRAS